MATKWQSFAVEFNGGLVTNTSPLQQGLKFPGSARELVNFEPSIEGGYRRIKGYTKYSASYVPPNSVAVVQGSGQSGTTLVLANVLTEPEEGQTVLLGGVTYTIETYTYNSANKTSTLTLDSALESSPSDKAEVLFGNNSDLIRGLAFFNSQVVACRNNTYYTSSESDWSAISKPTLGTVLVDGGGQTGTSLDVDGLTKLPEDGTVFYIAGVEKAYTVISSTTLTGTSSTFTITPALDSSPADNAALTFLSVPLIDGGKVRFTRYNFNGTEKIIFVDGANKPVTFNGTDFDILTDAPTDIVGAKFVIEFKNHLFFAKNNLLVFSSPFRDDDYSAALGAGVISIPQEITGLIVFRDNLIIFSSDRIFSVSGSSIADFAMSPIAYDVGCSVEDSIQEVGGDIMFAYVDGIRMLSATQRIGDFGFSVASRKIQTETERLLLNSTNFCSCVIRGKNQYRLFGYSLADNSANSKALLGMQFVDQSSSDMAWCELKGFKAYVAESVYSSEASSERAFFANEDGFVYRLESGNTFDGTNIECVFKTPYFSFDDPRLRKTFYKLNTYLNSEGSVSGSANLRLDFYETGVIQPSVVPVSNSTLQLSYYGSAVYNQSYYSGRVLSLFKNQLVGSGFVASIEYKFEGNEPTYSLDALVIEYAINDRQ